MTSMRSWVAGADASSDFSIANLPWGVFERADRPGEGRIGVAIGSEVVDVSEALGSGLLRSLDPALQNTLREETLNAFMSLGREAWSNAREAIQSLLLEGGDAALRNHPQRSSILLSAARLSMRLPAAIGDYTDFYASESHATNVGSMFRPEKPLLPNWKHLPIGYHGRASSIVPSGAALRRPIGQTVQSDDGPPSLGPCKLLDYELEMGAFVGVGNALGTPIDIARSREHLFGMVILNDWSARDIQKWEYQPLGPFNAKNFGSTISPWVVTFEALEPFFTDGPARSTADPQPLPYLRWSRDFLIDIHLEVLIRSAGMRVANALPTLVSRGSFTDLYWSLPQMLAHHTITGCNLRPGDLLGTGTISGAAKESRGCLLERTWRGSEPFKLGDGSERKFLADGDEVIMRAWCEKPGLPRVGFGECRGVIEPALSASTAPVGAPHAQRPETQRR